MLRPLWTYHRDRYLDIRLGRWNQPDRTGFVDGPNLYSYARSSPTRFRDANGQWVFGVGGSAAGQIFSAQRWISLSLLTVIGTSEFSSVPVFGVGRISRRPRACQVFLIGTLTRSKLYGVGGFGLTADLALTSANWSASMSDPGGGNPMLLPPDEVGYSQQIAWSPPFTGFGAAIGITAVVSYTWVWKAGTFLSWREARAEAQRLSDSIGFGACP
jgi:hypothetical protein